jgi:hypothetical protein
MFTIGIGINKLPSGWKYLARDTFCEWALAFAADKETASVAFAPSEEKLDDVSNSRIAPSMKFKSTWLPTTRGAIRAFTLSIAFDTDSGP